MLRFNAVIKLLNTVKKMAVRLALQPPQMRKRRYRGVEDPLHGWTDEDLTRRYRFEKHGIDFLTNLLKNDLERSTISSSALSVEQQLLLTSPFYASGSFLIR